MFIFPNELLVAIAPLAPKEPAKEPWHCRKAACSREQRKKEVETEREGRPAISGRRWMREKAFRKHAAWQKRMVMHMGRGRQNGRRLGEDGGEEEQTV